MITDDFHNDDLENCSSDCPQYITKDSGARETYPSGMLRDTQKDKVRYDLVDFPMLKRWAELMTRGSVKYGVNNWRTASGVEEEERFRASALRHMYQWLYNTDPSEDHAAAVYFNIAGAEMVKAKLQDIKDSFYGSREQDEPPR